MVGKLERNKDLVQDVVENTAHKVGNIASIITGAVVDVTREIGDLVTDGFEMREAAKAAKLAEGRELKQSYDDAHPALDPASAPAEAPADVPADDDEQA